MYRNVDTAKGPQLRGVLNDFDLAVTGPSPRSELERTGTIPFMALELLRSLGKDCRHEVKHDLEASYWIITWQAFCTPADVPPLFAEWRAASPKVCAQKKLSWQDCFHKPPWHDITPREGWHSIAHVVGYLVMGYKEINDIPTGPSPFGILQPDRERVNYFRQFVWTERSQSYTLGEWKWYADLMIKAAYSWRSHHFDFNKTEIFGDDSLWEVALDFLRRWEDLGIEVPVVIEK
jgi:hypothetical protein